MRCWQRRGPVAGMARSYTGEKVYFTLTFMVRIATPRTMKDPQGFVGAGFKPAQGVSGTHQERFRRRAGLKPAPTKPRFVLTSERFFTLTFMAPEPAPRMMKNFPVGAGLPAIAAPAAEQTPIRGQGRSYRKPCIFLLFTLKTALMFVYERAMPATGGGKTSSFAQADKPSGTLRETPLRPKKRGRKPPFLHLLLPQTTAPSSLAPSMCFFCWIKCSRETPSHMAIGLATSTEE